MSNYPPFKLNTQNIPLAKSGLKVIDGTELYFKNWTDDDLLDRMREIRIFGGYEEEAAMIQAESKRRQEEWEGKYATD